MDSSILTDYLEKIFKFALGKTFSEDEAEELSQEILLNAIASLPNLRDETRFEPWLWSLASNTAKTFRRYQGRQRAMFVYDAPESILNDFFIEDEDNDELISNLRKKVSILSKMYRDIIILHYYDGLSTKEIATRLDIPIGTVTWRLSAAREKLKKECKNMEETALKPVFLGIGIYGSGNYDGKERPFPCEYIRDALSQNILYHCYESPKGVEELSKLCGVPAYYVEDCLQNLEKRCAVIQTSKGFYQTDFIIWTDKYGKFCEEHAENAILPIMDQIIDALDTLSAEVSKLDIYRAGKTEDELKFLYGAMAFSYLSKQYSSLSYPKIPKNYDGNGWRYIGYMESGKYHRTGMGHQIGVHPGSRGTYGHENFMISGLGFRNMMPENYINVCEDILNYGKTDDEQSAAKAIQEGYITRNERGELFVTVPAFNKEQIKQFEELVEACFVKIMPKYNECINKFCINYMKLFPKHLEDDAKRMCQGMFKGFFDEIVLYCEKNNVFIKPDKNYICDVLIQFK